MELPLSSTERRSSSSSNARAVIAALATLAVCTFVGFASFNSAAQQSNAQLPERSLQGYYAELKQVKPSTDFFSRAAFRGQFNETSDFVVDINNLTTTTGPGGTSRTASVAQMPTLWGEGIALVQINLDACGINTLHTHPRSSEFTYVVSGEKVQMSFVEENGGRLISNELSTGQAALFPEGLIHYQYNMGCTPALLIAALSSEDFGTQTVTTNALDNMPDEGLAASMGITVKELTQIRSGFQANPAQAADCMKRCGLA